MGPLHHDHISVPVGDAKHSVNVENCGLETENEADSLSLSLTSASLNHV